MCRSCRTVFMVLLAATDAVVLRNLGLPGDGEQVLPPNATTLDNISNKRLVLFAGPHNSAASRVEDFFFRYARGRDVHESSVALGDWIWPIVDADVANLVPEGEEPYTIFKHLVTSTTKKEEENDDSDAEAKDEPDNTVELEDAIWAAIDQAWQSATTSIVLGTEAFDRGIDGIEAMRRVVEHLHVDPQDVTVVINYRTPRLDQWLSIYLQSVAETASSYEDWMCNSHEYGKKIRLLATQMNPLQLAMKVLDAGWKVAIMDLGGIQEMGGDVVQIIACNVLMAKCSDNGGVPLLNGYGQEVDNDIGGNLTAAKIATGLSKSNLVMTEELFRIRDCEYQKELTKIADDGTDNTVELHFPTWTGEEACSVEASRKMMQNPEIVFQALLSQLECRNDPYHFKNMFTINQLLGTEAATSEPVESWGFVLLELIVYGTVLLASFLYQLYRMYNSIASPSRRRPGQLLGTISGHRRKEAATQEAEMTELTASAADLDAEYGDVDNDDDGNDDGFVGVHQAASESKRLSSNN